MSETLNPLDQVKLDAERITRKRMQELEESIAWQESQDRPVSHDEVPEVGVEVKEEAVKPTPKAKAEKKGKK